MVWPKHLDIDRYINIRYTSRCQRPKTLCIYIYILYASICFDVIMQIVCHTSEEGRRDQRPAVEDILKCRHRSVTNIKWEVLRHFVLLQCHVFDYALILVSNLLRGTTFWSGQALVPSNKASTSGSGLASFESNQPWQRYATCKDMAGGSRKRQAT